MTSRNCSIPKSVHHNIEIKSQHRKCSRQTNPQTFCDCTCCCPQQPTQMYNHQQQQMYKPQQQQKMYTLQQQEFGMYPNGHQQQHQMLPNGHQQQHQMLPNGQQYQPTGSGSNKYKQPQYNSVMGKVHQMQVVQSLKPMPLKSTGDLTPRTKAMVAPKITSKMNFNPNQKIFKNLLPINVNDSILLPHETTSIRKKYAHKATNKIPPPDLGDFLDPVVPLTHVIPEPEINLQIPKQKMNYFDQYKKLYP